MPRPSSPLRAFGARSVQHPFEGRLDTRKRRRFKEQTKSLPKCPGVYFFHGLDDRLLYIGKAKCLRERVRSYFSDTSLPRPNKIKRLLVEIERMHVRPCGSELEALLLERRLIADLQPLLNRQLKRFKVYPYLLLSDEEFPRFTVTRAEPVDEQEAGSRQQEAEEPALPASFMLPAASLALETAPYPGELPGLYLGPFTTPRHAWWTLEAVRALFPLRSCEGAIVPSAQGQNCFYGEIGRCCAPCVETTNASTYQALCDDLLRLLRTGQAPQLERLRARMMQRAEELRFEEAGEIKQQIEAIELVAARLRRLEAMRHKNNVVIAQSGLPDEDGTVRLSLFLVRYGAVRRHLTLRADEDGKPLRRALREVYETPYPAPDYTAKAELDEMMILDRWLQAHGDEPCCAWINETGNRQWISNTVRALTRNFEPQGTQRNAGEEEKN